MSENSENCMCSGCGAFELEWGAAQFVPMDVGLPSGGNVGDIIVKTSNDDASAEWTAPADSVAPDNNLPVSSAAVYAELEQIHGMLPGGKKWQVPVKKTLQEYDIAWEDLRDFIWLELEIDAQGNQIGYSTEVMVGIIQAALNDSKKQPGMILTIPSGDVLHLPLTRWKGSTYYSFAGIYDGIIHSVSITRKSSMFPWDRAYKTMRIQEAEVGKGLSTEDFTTAEKEKLAGVESGAEVNVIEEIRQYDPIKQKFVPLSVTDKCVDLPEIYVPKEVFYHPKFVVEEVDGRLAVTSADLNPSEVLNVAALHEKVIISRASFGGRDYYLHLVEAETDYSGGSHCCFSGEIDDGKFLRISDTGDAVSWTATMFSAAEDDAVGQAFEEVYYAIPKTAADVGAVASNQGAVNDGKVLMVGSDGMVTPQDAVSGGQVFFADYGVTTSAEVEAAIAGGKLVALKRGGMIYTLTETHKMGAISVYRFASLRKDYYAIIELSNDRWSVVNNNSPIGTYSKPASGIPKTDLDSDVQTLLEKADEDKRFVVTLTPTAQDFSGVMDKTCAEITAAYEAGKDIWLEVDATAIGYELWRVKATIEAKVNGENYGQVMAFLINMQMTPPSMIFIFTDFNTSGDSNRYITQIFPLATGPWTGGSY